jgi:uncharacterized membrane protein YfcA
MSNEEFTKQQYLALKDEIRDSKTRIFWLMIIAITLVMISGYLAAEYPSAFANAATPFLLIALMLSFTAEQNNISRAGRYVREVIEPASQDHPGWEHWLEMRKEVREVDHSFVVGFTVLFVAFFAIATSLTLRQLDKQGQQWLVACAMIAYVLGAVLMGYVMWRHWKSSMAPDVPMQ